MPDPTLFGYPLSTLILYFVFYSVVGWAMETVYCSIPAKRFVPRGFLHGPLCPIYGVGVLLMILFFEPLKGNLFIFYLVSTVTMSAWEYFVGWFLETTTHVKYWDYSNFHFNLKGRICLWVCLTWGILSYVTIFWIHPPVASLFDKIPPLARQISALFLTALILIDAVFTIRELALVAKAMKKLEELSGKLSSAKDMVAEKLKAGYSELLSSAEKRTRRFRRNYVHLNVPKLDIHLKEAIRERARQVAQDRQARKAEKKEKQQ